MTLRARLLLGYGYLVGLLLVAVGSATLGFFHLSAGIEVVLEDNFRSIQAAMTMIETLERQDSATLAALIEGRTETRDMELHEEAFREAVAEAADNVTEDEEPGVLAAIREEFAAYRAARDRLLAARLERPLAAYNREVFPRFAAVKSHVLRLLAINQEAMIRTDREVREAAVQSGTWLGFLAVVALLSFVFLSRMMQSRILGRLDRLRDGIAAVAAGRRRRLREEGEDELALIARNVNRLLDRYDELKGRSQGRLAQERRLVLGLLGASKEAEALFSLSGELLAGGLEDRELEGRVVEWIREEGRGRAEAARPTRATVGAGGEEVAVDLVIAPGDRPAGWLVRREEN